MKKIPLIFFILLLITINKGYSFTQDATSLLLTKSSATATYVNKAGDTVTGNLRIDGQYGGAIFNVGSDSNTIAIDWDNGNTQQIEIIGTSTFTFTNEISGGKYTLAIKQGGAGSFTVFWPATVNWGDAGEITLNTAVGKLDYIGFIFNDLESEFHALAQGKGF